MDTFTFILEIIGTIAFASSGAMIAIEKKMDIFGVNILGATVQELQENVMCVFILQLIGTEEKILEAEKQIDGNGVIRERVEAI